MKFRTQLLNDVDNCYKQCLQDLDGATVSDDLTWHSARLFEALKITAQYDNQLNEYCKEMKHEIMEQLRVKNIIQ